MLDRFSADAYFPKMQPPLPPKKRSTKKPLAKKFLAQKTPPEEPQAMARHNGLLRENNSDRVSDDKRRYGKDRCLSDSTKMQPSSKMARRTTAREPSIDIANENLASRDEAVEYMIGLEDTYLVHRWCPQFFCKAMSKFLKTLGSPLARQQFLEEYFAGVHPQKVNTLYPDPTFCLVLC
jgi:hypothetical protein